MNDINEKIIPVHTESIDSNDSLETCIICLDDVDENTIYFPSKYSSCSCKYTIHLRCIKENNINKCVICNAVINYPVNHGPIQKDMFGDNNRSVNPANVDINVTNSDIDIYRHRIYEGYSYCSNCDNSKKLYICILSFLISGAFCLLIWMVTVQISA